MGKHRSVKTSRQVLSLRIRAFGHPPQLFGSDLPASMRNGKSTRSQVLAKLAEKLIVSSGAVAILAIGIGARSKRSASPTNTAFLAAFGSFDEIDFGASGDPSLKTVSSVGITGACKCQITKVVAERKGLIAGNSGKSHKHRQKLLSHSHWEYNRNSQSVTDTLSA